MISSTLSTGRSAVSIAARIWRSSSGSRACSIDLPLAGEVGTDTRSSAEIRARWYHDPMPSGLETGFLLDRQWHWMRSGMEQTKKPALLALGKVLAETGVPYAIIGGVALQIPQTELEAAGFFRTGEFQHSENWIGPEETPVQFTDDPLLGPAVMRADEIEIDGVRLRVLRRSDLLHEKLRAAIDPARRRSKRLQDMADAESLLEADPDLAAELTPEEKAALDRLPP